MRTHRQRTLPGGNPIHAEEPTNEENPQENEGILKQLGRNETHVLWTTGLALPPRQADSRRTNKTEKWSQRVKSLHRSMETRRRRRTRHQLRQCQLPTREGNCPARATTLPGSCDTPHATARFSQPFARGAHGYQHPGAELVNP